MSGDGTTVRYADLASQTEFAQDTGFGFGHSNLRSYIEEKMSGHRETPSQ
jgi:hypothetical protein